MRLRTPALASTTLATAALVLLAGCSDPAPEPAPTQASVTATAPEPDTTSPEADTTSPEEGTDITGPDADLATMVFAVDAAAALTASEETIGAEGIVHDLELDYSRTHSAWVWEVETLVDGVDHEIKIHADTGEVLDHDTGTTDDTKKPISLTTPMTQADALALALAKVNGRVTSWELGWDDGIQQYEFEFESGGSDREVSVEVDTSRVISD